MQVFMCAVCMYVCVHASFMVDGAHARRQQPREATPAAGLESENQEVPHGRIGARVGEITRVCDLLTTGVDCHDAMRGSPL